MKEIYAEVLTIGDELLYGQILDTNTKWVSQELDDIGIKVRRKISIGDKKQEILEALDECLKRSDIVLITGGLGPTKDDITKKTLAEYFDMELALDPSALEDVEDIFKRFGKALTEINRQQAFLPEGCKKIKNERGTAPGMWFEQGRKVVVSMPGVPFEMEAMMAKTILPKLKKHYTLPVIVHKVIKTIGIGESWLAEEISSWEDALPDHLGLAYLPGKGQVRLRLTGVGESREEVETEMDQQINEVLPKIKSYVYGFGDIQIEDAVGELLKSQSLTISTAESCTGGFLAHRLTSVPGSSEYYLGSVVSYHNDIKKETLGVEEKTLEAYGAVSEETASEMAVGIRKKFKTDIGISTTGIAGPDGGTEEKPVGTVWLAISFGKNVFTRKIQLPGTRILNIEYTAIHALNFLRQTLEKP
ncbi:competence/damage-inducible protein A [Reichenbachiella carrageenanivorans]|uniref:CinA-like protein n=1 Tax=Reichenbachiella carrageenanivorans TaxID=2979869 RepID=A0ABY6CWN5_9BACT|nr:competence/damage-inducible protein A [Reichenbachiella carrageenanivorans]UXX78329.1 competence/damage-inducible protein A [Reichenbachiella carrageenanivorans]